MPVLLGANALCTSLLLWTLLPWVPHRLLQVLVGVAGSGAPF